MQLKKSWLSLSEVSVCLALILGFTFLTPIVMGQVSGAGGKNQTALAAKDMDNLRRLGLAVQQYIADKDDFLPVLYDNSSVCLPNMPTSCGWRDMWQFAVYPYHHDWSIMGEPGLPLTGNAEKDAFNVSYGYNYNQMSIMCIKDDSWSQSQLGCPPNDVGSPGQQVFFVAVSATHVENPGFKILLTDSGGKDLKAAATYGSTVVAPDALNSWYYSIDPLDSGWGLNCRTYFSKNYSGTTGKWGDTDGFAYRYFGGANVITADGSATWLTPAQAAEGTNWTPTINCVNVRVNNYDRYRWNPYYRGSDVP